MWDFSDDEWVFLIAAAVAIVVGGVQYYRPLFAISPLGKSRIRHNVLGLLPVAAIIPTAVVLSRYADAQVVGHVNYMTLFMLGAGAWVFGVAHFMDVLGISIRDDAMERNNLAALVAACGIVLGAGIVYALANVGVGPTIWTTIVPAAVGTVLLELMILLVEMCGGTVAEAVSIDRDIASAMLLAGLSLGCAIVLGRAAAGDWVSWKRTWLDFVVRGWPALLLAMVAGIAHRWLEPTAANPHRNVAVRGIVPAALFVLAGSLFAFVL